MKYVPKHQITLKNIFLHVASGILNNSTVRNVSSADWNRLHALI